MSNDVEQAVLLGLSAAGMTMLAAGGQRARWGAVVSLMAQPMWLAATWRAEQWGMFVLALINTGCFVWMVWRTCVRGEAP
jgi:hypothetical protein